MSYDCDFLLYKHVMTVLLQRNITNDGFGSFVQLAMTGRISAMFFLVCWSFISEKNSFDFVKYHQFYDKLCLFLFLELNIRYVGS